MRGYDVYCFSPTGGCRRVADALELGCPGARRTDLTRPGDRAAAMPPEPGRLFTLLFPVYAQRMPGPLRRWLRTLPARGGRACLIAVYGSVSAGNALADAAALLERELGVETVAAAELPGPHAFDCAQTDRDLHAPDGWTAADLLDFFSSALDKAAGEGGAVSIPRRLVAGGIFPQDFLPNLGSPYPAPDLSKCTGCGACDQACPTDAIRGRRSDCIRCTACIRACPASARVLRFRTGIPGLYLEHNIQKQKEAHYFL